MCYAVSMIRRVIDLDEESDEILSKLAQEHEGDLGRALSELLHVHRGLENLADQTEEANHASLATQKERAEAGFREGRFTTWDEIKRRHGL